MKILLLTIFCLPFFALGHDHTTLVLNDPSINGSATCGSYINYLVDFSYPCRDLNIALVKYTGAPEIYVSKVEEHPTKKDLTWSSNTLQLTISHWDPESSPGTYYISIYNNCKYQSKKASYAIQVTDTSNDDEDILANPGLSFNMTITALDYAYYRFCLPSCADVRVTLQNCLDDSQCPGAYAYPELLVSRTEESSTVYDYTYKLAQVVRRNIDLDHTDPSARDHNGYMRGSYYVGVYGWCTPDEFVLDPSVDGPCSYASKTKYNVTVQIVNSYDDSVCTDNTNLVYPTLPPIIKHLDYDETVQGQVDCNSYVYYTINATEPCTGMRVYLGNSSSETSVPELSISRYPNYRPTFDNLQWTSYDWGFQNLTIDIYDPNFYAGYICGESGEEACMYVVGVYGYCAGAQEPVTYTMQVSKEYSSNVFDMMVKNTDQLQPNGVERFEFCYSKQKDVYVDFIRHSACNCSSSYNNMQLYLSRTKRTVDSGDLSWSIDTDEELRGITLSADDEQVKPGTYYITVETPCSTDCEDECTCSPCSNLEEASFAIRTTYSNDAKDLSASHVLGPCAESDANTCSDICAADNYGYTSSSSSKKKLSSSQIAGVVVGVIVFSAIAIVLVFLAFGAYSRLHVYKTTGKGDPEEEFQSLSQHAADPQPTTNDTDVQITLRGGDDEATV